MKPDFALLPPKTVDAAPIINKYISELEAKIKRLVRDCVEWERSFDLYNDAMRRGSERWRAEEPYRRRWIVPDGSALAVWLLTEIERLEQRHTEYNRVNQILIEKNVALQADVSKLAKSYRKLKGKCNALWAALENIGVIAEDLDAMAFAAEMLGKDDVVNGLVVRGDMKAMREIIARALLAQETVTEKP